MQYQWGSPSTSTTTTIFLPEEELKLQVSNQPPPLFLDQYHHHCLTGADHEELLISNSPVYHHQPLHQFYIPQSQQQVPTPNCLELLCLGSPMLPAAGLAMPKLEEELACAGGNADHLPVHIGLNLGGRTYFPTLTSLPPPCEVDLGFGGFFQRPRLVKQRLENLPRCQAEGCTADLSLAKLYYRRHKVCEFHSKAASVVAAGITKRFCQQCSRFHELPEFDEGKRSCRKRLAEHNRRRRKFQPPQGQSQTKYPGFYLPSKYPSESGGTTESSSVTVAAISPLMALEWFQAGQQDASCSSSSCLSLFAGLRPLDPRL